MKHNCNCGRECCCEKIIKSISVKVSDTNLQIEIPNIDLYEFKKFDLVLCQSIPSSAVLNSYPVQFIITGTTTPIAALNRIGNTLRADQIRTRKLYNMVYGTDTDHITLFNRVPESNGAPVV